MFEDFEDDVDDALLAALSEYTEESSVNGATSRNAANESGLSKPAVKSSPLQLSDQQVNVPDSFQFPFEPYAIQLAFMKELYTTLELGKIGIFESPTGTGKSLSLICGALTWLRDFEEKQRRELEVLLAEEEEEKNAEQSGNKQISKDSELDWITAFAKKQEEDESKKKVKEEREKRLKREAKLEEIRNNVRRTQSNKRKRDLLEEKFDYLFQGASDDLREQFQKEMNSEKTGTSTEEEDEEEDEKIVVSEYHSDEEAGRGDEDTEEEEDKDEDEHVTKIYFCSRTHSQLSQFLHEVQKSPFQSDIRAVALGSRQNLCINKVVRKLHSLSLMNDRCLEMQKNKKEPRAKDGEAKPKRKKNLSGSCPFYKQENMLDLRDKALSEVQDIEELVSAGKQLKACPYYGTRYAIPAAQLVVLPYNTLLHKSTREACGIKLTGNIVIIDEAHNLLETINNVYSTEVTGSQLTRAHSQLCQYQSRYQSRLKAKNLMYIKQILHILSACIKYLGGQTGIPAESQHSRLVDTKLQSINDFLFSSKLDNLNLFKVLKYCEKSQISKKLHGFVEKYQPVFVKPVEEKPKESSLTKFLKEIQTKSATKETPVEESSSGPDHPPPSPATLASPLMHIEGFLAALTTADKDGRIVVNRQSVLSQSSLKFLLLNPAVHFSSVVSEARAVIVAGGTMKPISEFEDQLFRAAGASADRIHSFSCGHIVPSDQLLPIALAQGPSGHKLDFTYQSRDQPKMLDELGRVLCNVCTLVPGGVVCFFPSYDYEKLVYTYWEKSGCLARIAAKKKIFREPKKANQVDSTLTEYANCIYNSTAVSGAVLFCVVGGKMSEGINFSDQLGRCIVMVGLPYPNIRSPELKEKMDYLNANVPKGLDGKSAGQQHYENLCMKAVNQSIGRAIRHLADYATILLLDQRYQRPSVSSQLPDWIAKDLQKMDKFGSAYAAIRKFFSGKK